MTCSKCKHWHAVGHPTRKRCLVAAPLQSKSDKAQAALTEGLDGCAAGDALQDAPKEARTKDNK